MRGSHEEQLEFVQGWKSRAQGKIRPPRNFLAADVAVEYFREAGRYESTDAAKAALDCRVWTPNEPGTNNAFLTDFQVFADSFAIVPAKRKGVDGYQLKRIPLLAIEAVRPTK